MQVKLNLIAGAAALLIGGAVYAQDLVVKIGHVGPTSGFAAGAQAPSSDATLALLIQLSGAATPLSINQRLLP